ncbi:MAG: ATP/GTP-binding protein [Theionarchaea archaeon]|nr:ATP/GTP-binding protein [Theionarchaea archaeon]
MKVMIFLGTAGSGKSSMVSGAKEWFMERGANAMIANLDPGAERLPYVPDVDVRDYIQLDEVMDRYGLGPNGAMIVASDLVAEDFSEILGEIEGYTPDYLMVDTPGQLELFVFRASGIFIVEALSGEQTMASFLVDPFMTQTPSSFTSIMLLSATAQLKLGVPVIRILSKSDILTEEQMERIDNWIADPDILYDALLDERGPSKSLATGVCGLLADTEESFDLVKVSAREGWGYEELYAQIQLAYEAGDDFIVPEP